MKRFLAKKCYLRIVACVMVFCMCATAFAGNVGIGAFADGAISVWDGTDSYADLAAVVADMGAADGDGYYHITTPNQLHAVIKYGGGANNYKLDNDIYLNTDYENYADWSSAAPANEWSFNTKNFYTGAGGGSFRGSIDGCGHTVYGLYSNGGKAYNGLIPQTGAGAVTTTVIKNLNVWYSYVKVSARAAGILIGSTYSGNYSNSVNASYIEGCSVRYAAVDVDAGNSVFGGIVGLSRRKTTISYCSVADVVINPTYSAGTTTNNYGGLCSIVGSNYEGNTATTNTLNATQAKFLKITNCYAVNVVNTAVENDPVYVAGVFDSGSSKWGFCISAYNVYTDAATVSHANDENIKLLVSLDGDTAVSASDANYPIRTISANGIKGDAAKTAMPYLCWDFWKTVDNDYPVYVDNDKSTATNVWDGTTDTYEDIEEVISALGATDAEGYYHITIPAQLHAVINHQGGGYNYRLDNDLVLNSDYKNYAAWQYTRNQPANTWQFNQASNWNASSMTPFTGTIDGCGHTIYGLFSDTTGNYNGLIGATKDTTVIKNLNVSNIYINATGRAGVLVGCKRSGTLTIDSCSVSNAFIKGSWENVPAGGMVGITYPSRTTISNCAVTDVKFTGTVTQANATAKENPYAFGSFIGAIYMNMQGPDNAQTVNHTQADNNYIQNSYALRVINLTNSNSPVYICGLFHEGTNAGNNTKWGYSVTATDVYTDATTIPCSNLVSPQVSLLVTDDGYRINNTIKTPSDDNYAGLFSSSAWYMGVNANSVPIQKSKTAYFEHLDITGEGIDDAYNSFDLICLTKNLLGISGYEHILGDLNDDGEIDIVDIVSLETEL